MAYTSIAKIERDKALAQALRGNMGQEILPNWASGLAYVINQYGASKRGKRASEMESENERLYSEDLATALKGGDQLPGPTQSGQPLMRQYQTPQGQMTALQRALQDKEFQQEREIAQLRSGGSAGYGNTVVTMQDQNGNYIPARMTPQGLVPLDTGGMNYIPDAGRLSYDPSAISTRRGAETQAEVQNIQATAAPSAQAAGMEAEATASAQAGVERGEETFKADIDNLNQAYKAVQGAISNIGSIQQVLAVNDFADQGTAAPLINATKGLFASVGIQIDNLEDNALLQQGIDRILASYMNEMGARGLTDRDMDVLRNNLPRLNQSANARRAVAEVLKSGYYGSIQNYERQRNQFAEKYGEGLLPMAPQGFENLLNGQSAPAPQAQMPQGSRSFDDLLREYGASTP